VWLSLRSSAKYVKKQREKEKKEGRKGSFHEVHKMEARLEWVDE
jgi:hypothetical protein